MEETTAPQVPTVAANGWPVVIAPLADDRQGYGCPRARVFIVDSGVPAHCVGVVLDELVAATRGDWTAARHASTERPELRLVHSSTRKARSRRRGPELCVVPDVG